MHQHRRRQGRTSRVPPARAPPFPRVPERPPALPLARTPTSPKPRGLVTHPRCTKHRQSQRHRTSSVRPDFRAPSDAVPGHASALRVCKYRSIAGRRCHADDAAYRCTRRRCACARARARPVFWTACALRRCTHTQSRGLCPAAVGSRESGESHALGAHSVQVLLSSRIYSRCDPVPMSVPKCALADLGSVVLVARRRSTNAFFQSGARSRARVVCNFAPRWALRDRSWSDLGIALALRWANNLVHH